jgi:acyl carrier protein
MSPVEPNPVAMTEQEIFVQLQPLVADVLAIAPEKVRRESVLIADLGAESIDLLDLSFRIEEQFKVTIQADEIEREAKRTLTGGVYEKDGCLTEEALAEIRRAMPELKPEKLVKGLRKSQLPSLLTVAFFVRLIARKQVTQTGETSHA